MEPSNYLPALVMLAILLCTVFVASLVVVRVYNDSKAYHKSFQGLQREYLVLLSQQNEETRVAIYEISHRVAVLENLLTHYKEQCSTCEKRPKILQEAKWPTSQKNV